MIDREKSFDHEEIRAVCAHLFAPEKIKSDQFIKNLSFDMVRKAYRDKAKLYHPDVHPEGLNETMQQKFNTIREAHETIITYLEQSAPANFIKKKIISVGGAKGGIGKSMFAVNYGILLSSMGYKTVIVDLDLGGANIHLYLGNRTILKKTINDFINKRANTLQEVMIKSKYGPYIVGGDSSEFGVTNIDFLRKLKLIKAVREIDADFVVVDLGGDITYNTIDFFLAADYGIVMATHESAAYIEAYHFMKAVLFRQMIRLFGPESKFHDTLDNGLKTFIAKAFITPGEMQVRTIEEFLERVNEQQHVNLPLIQKVLSNFDPLLVINNVPSDLKNDLETQNVVKRIQGVSKKWLSKEVSYLGHITHDPVIGRSAIDLVPVVAKYPNGKMAKELRSIFKKMMAKA